MTSRNSSDPSVPTPPAPRPGVLDIEAYVPGRSKAAGDGPVYKLSSNESALGPSPAAREALAGRTDHLHLYPDGGATDLREAIARLHGLDPVRMVCGAGSDELIQLLCKGYLADGDNIVQTAHGFLVYALAAKACGAEVRFAPEVNLHADVDTILAQVDARTRLVFLANPNNPTGTFLPRTALERLHTALPDNILLVLDGAYAEYMENEDYEDGLAMVAAGGNIVVTRTFSKIYGLGGLRLGWAYCPTAVADVLNRIRGPFNVSSLAQIAGIAAIEDQAFVRRNREHNRTQRAVMSQRLRGLGIEITPSVANFLLLHLPSEPGPGVAEVDRFLADHGVIVREVSAYGLPDHLRISIGSEEANARFLDLMASLFDQRGA